VCLGDTGNRPVLSHALQLMSKFWYKLVNYRMMMIIIMIIIIIIYIGFEPLWFRCT
jgi:hypothetical protein